MHKDQLSFSSKEYMDIIIQLLRQDAVNLAIALLERLPLITLLPASLHDEALEVLIRKGNLVDALKWHELTFSRLKEPVSIGTFNRLLKLLTKKTPSKNLDSVYSLYQVLRTSPLIKFDSVTLSILAHACCEQSRDDLLYRLFNELEERNEELTIEFYNGIITALLGPKRREVTAARQILKKIYEKFGGPNLRTINILMNLYARRGHPSGAISLLLQAKKMSSQLQRKETGRLDDMDYSIRILMYANARAGNTQNVQHLFDHLRRRDLHDLSAFNILIYSYARSGRIKAMMETWRELNKGFSGDIYTYTPMLKALSRFVDSSDSLAWAKEVWLYMIEQKAPLTSKNCQAALQVFQRLGEREWEGRVVQDVQQYLASSSNTEGRTEEEAKRYEELINWLLMFL